MKLAASIGALALAACGLPEDQEYFGEVPSLEGRDLKHLRWCNSGEVGTLDPAMATTTTEMKPLYSMFDGLFVYDAKGQPEPSLATSLEQTDDLRRFTFRLRDDARWSNGRGITAYDFAYHLVRVLHPLTASPNGDALFPVRNGEEFLSGTVRVVMNDLPGLPAGTIVDVISAGGKTEGFPNSSERRSKQALALRDLGAAETAAYARVPANTTVIIVEIAGRPASVPAPPTGGEWAYVFWRGGGDDGLYGWVPLAQLDQQPHGDVEYQVRPVSRRRVPGDPTGHEQLVGDDLVPRAIFRAHGRDLLVLPEVLGIRVPDPYTLVVETEPPTPWLLNIAAQRSMRATPREAVARNPKRWAEPGSIVVSGGMTLVAWKERDYLRLAKNDFFWDRQSVKLDKITVFSVADQAAVTNYYYTGGCDATTTQPAPTTYLPVLNGEKRGGKPYKDYVVAPWNGVYYAIVNTKRFPNRHFRRALSYAVDRTGITAITKGGQIPSAQFTPGTPISKLTDDELARCGVPRDHPGVAMLMAGGHCYVPPPGLDFDPEKARAELAQARAEMGASFPKTITYRYNLGSEAHKLIAEYLQQSWQRVLGLNVRLESQEWKTMVNDTRAGNFETARFGNIANFADTEAEFLPNFKCASPDNRPQWCHPEFEAAINAAEKLADRKERLKLIYKAEQVMVEDVPVVPIYAYAQQILIRPYVRGLDPNPVDQQRLDKAWIDPNWESQRAEARR